jgi:alkanesulfonate monooxygenase SsuD/methylene tetrahydromethanopterin reductase-like flavin-dependent oxidoreductase (luciferase family)
MRVGCSVAEDRAAAREEMRGYVTVGAETVFGAVPKEKVPPELWEDLRRLNEAYDFDEHGSASAPQAAFITDRILDSIAIAGTPEEALPRFEELAALGVDGFQVTTTARDPEALLRLLAERVIPEVA